MMRAVLLGLALWILPVLAGAQDYTADAQTYVDAALVSETLSVQPGSSTRVALKLTHAEGWHTYWDSPGVGEATEIDWTLPEGWLADAIDWPVPTKILTRDGSLSGHGFKGIVYLPVRLTVPGTAPVGETVTLNATASWLVCEYEICIPGSADLSLGLLVSSDAPLPNEGLQAALADQAMPEFGEDWTFDVTRDGTDYVVTIAAPEPLSEPHFYCDASLVEFCDDGLFWVQTEQVFSSSENGELTLSFTVDETFAESDIPVLAGVLAFTDAAGNKRGVLMSAPVSVGALSGAVSGDTLELDVLLQALLFAFLGGLILNLMPCVLPILSLKALSFAKMSSDNPSAARRDGLAYTAGVLLSFAVIAGLLLFVRATFGGVGWGFQLQNPIIVLMLALLIAAVGFNLLGVFEIGSSVQGTGQGLIRGENLSASFFTGVLAVVVAAPCTAPFMASALGVALVQPAPIAVAIFLALGFGLAFPYLLLSFVPGARAFLPKPGPWMITMKQVLAFSMFATCVWLLWVLGGQVGHNGMAVGLIAILLLGMTVGAFAKDALVWKVVGSVTFVIMLYTAFSVANLPKLSATQNASDTALFESAPYSEAALTAALDAGDPLFVYFTADWCIICKVNERVAIYTDDTAAYFTEAGISVMVGDWTSYDAEITAILTRYDRAGVPMYLYFAPGAGPDDGRVLPQTLTPSILRDAIEEQA